MKIKSKYPPTGRSYKRSALVIILLVAIYLLDFTPLKTYISSFKYTYILKPAIWIGMAGLIQAMPRIKPESKLRHRGLVNLWAFNFSLIYVLINIFTGIMFGFGNSPYDHSLRGIIINIIFVGAILIGKEYARGFLVSNSAKGRDHRIFLGIALLMTVMNYPIKKYMELGELESGVKFLAGYFIPELSHNIFANYLVFLGGPLASVVYLGLIQGFDWLSPVLPNLKWIVRAIIGTLFPIFFMMFFQSIYLSTAKLIKRRESENKITFGWILVSTLSIFIIWFAVGVFPLYPSVIATGSMEPVMYPGDIILVNKITDAQKIKDLRTDDIIQFKRDSVLITHRIIEIADDYTDGMLFKTKGDNNSGMDEYPVKPQDIKGKVKHVVPKLGWLTLLMKSSRDIPFDEIVF